MGKAKQLRDRVSSYFRSYIPLGRKTKLLVSQINKIDIIIVESELEALLLEANLIKKFSPKFNVRLRDGKNYPLIRIAKKYKYPAVLTARKMDDVKSIYFGPYPSSSAMYNVIRLIRRIFPFSSTLNHPPKICLYYHLGLCPCTQFFVNENRMYKKTIKHIIDFLGGNTKKVIKDLKKERDTASKFEDFELAAVIQRQIDEIFYVCQPIRSPFDYVVNPNLLSDQRIEEMEDLRAILAREKVHIDLPKRIECYDNSNIQGTNPVSSMVVLTNGEIDKSQYRKFKISTVKGPDDFESMKEVLRRRLRHTDWPMPDLFVVDGGKGQVSAAKEVLEKYFPELPLVGLAKQEEIIITSDLKEIILPRSSGALNLLMRVRDEAHRFAITYHRKLRSKNAML